MGAPRISGPQQVVAVTPPDVVYPPQTWKLVAVNRFDGYIAIDPGDANHLVGVCRKFGGPGLNYQDALEAQYSFDGGNTWSTVDLAIGSTQVYSVSDPWIGIGPDGTVYAIGLAVVTTNTEGGSAEAATEAGNGVLCYTSLDGGRSWDQPVTIVSDVWCDQTFGGVDLNTGRVYAIWFDGSLALAYSDDLGQTWNASSSAQPENKSFDLGNDQFNFINMSVGPDSAVHIIGMNEQGAMSYARSLDSGSSFEWGQIAAQQNGVNDIQSVIGAFEPTNLSAPILAVVNPPTILAIASIPTPQIYAAWSLNVGQPGAPSIRICIANSIDNGETWIANLIADTAPQSGPLLSLGDLSQTPQDHYFRPRLCAGPMGTMACAFSYCQLAVLDPLIPVSDQLPVRFGTFMAVSASAEVVIRNKLGTVLGFYFQYFEASATTVVQVSDRLSPLYSVNPVFRWGTKGSYFIGDFIGLCASPTTFFPYWSESTVGWQLFVGILTLSK